MRFPAYLHVTSGLGSPLTLHRISAFVKIFGYCGLGTSSNVMASATDDIRQRQQQASIYIQQRRESGKNSRDGVGFPSRIEVWGGSKFSQRSVGRVPSRKRFWCILGLHMKQLLVITSHHSSTLGRHGDPKLKGEGEHVSPVPNGLMPTNVRLCRCDERLQRE